VVTTFIGNKVLARQRGSNHEPLKKENPNISNKTVGLEINAVGK